MPPEDDTNPLLTSGKAAKSVPFRIVSGILILGFIISVVLILAALFESPAPEPVTAASNTSSANTASSEESAVQGTASPDPVSEMSPQALEDLRSDPALSLTIDPVPLLLEPLPDQPGDNPEDDIATTDDAPLSPPEEPFSVGEALARYLLAIRTELNSEYVASCIRFRNRNGAGADCPDNPDIAAANYQQEQALVDELFAIITREEDARLISSRLERENVTLAAMLDDPENPAALQASTKLALNNSYLAYLNGNPNPDVAAFNTMNDFINDYNRTIRVGPVQFRCQDGPCVYQVPSPDTP